LILIEGENIHIWGRGAFDGSGTAVRAQGRPANLIRVRNSKNVLVEGIIQRDPAAWNTHILYCENVVFRGVKVLNDFALANTDGFDPDASKNVIIEDCFAYCNDDNIAIKTTNNLNLLQNVENITVRNCVFYTRKSSLKVGTETKGAMMRNILFENNDVIGCDRGLALYCNDGALFEDIRWVNNRIEKNVPDSQRRAIMFRISNRYGKGNIRNLLIKDCVFYEDFPNKSTIEGLDEEHTIEGIVFDNVINNGKKAMSLEDFGIQINAFVKNVTFK
jgi:polygalacturonase